jgi:hypothetical protein
VERGWVDRVTDPTRARIPVSSRIHDVAWIDLMYLMFCSPRSSRSTSTRFTRFSFRCLRNGFDRAEEAPLQSRRGSSPSSKAGSLER